MSLAELRDIVVIVYGAMGVVLMLGMTVAAFGLWFAIRSVARSVRALLDDPIRPTLEEVRRTAENVRGTSEFLSDTAVHPLIRVVAIGRGLRRGVATVTGVRNRRK